MIPEPAPGERQAGIRPSATLLRSIDRAGRRLLPLATTAAAVLLLAFPLAIPGQAALQSAVLLLSVYFWSIYRPLSMPPSAAFLLGLLADLLGPQPPGITMLVLLALGGTAVRIRVAVLRQGALVVWLAFALASGVAAFAEWAITSALDLRLEDPRAALLTWGLAAGLYPLIAAALIRLHRGLAAPERA